MLLLQLCVERIVGAHGMINYVDARTAWMDDIVKQAQWQGITQVTPLPAHDRESHSTPVYSSVQVYTASQTHIQWRVGSWMLSTRGGLQGESNLHCQGSS